MSRRLAQLIVLCGLMGTEGCRAADRAPPPGYATVVRPGRTIIDGRAASLSTVSRLVVSSDGLVAFDQPDDPKLIVVDPRSGVLSRFGRRGQGPGEFVGSPSLGWAGDTLLVTGQGQAAFSPAGRLLRSVHLSRQLVLLDDRDSSAFLIGSGQVVGPLESGEYLAELYLQLPSSSSPGGRQSFLRGAVATAVVGDSSGKLMIRMPSFDQQGCRGAFCPRYLVAVAPDGSRFAVVGPGVTKNDSVTATLHVFDAAGYLLLSMQLAAPNQAIPQRVLDSAEATIAGRGIHSDVLPVGSGRSPSNTAPGGASASGGDRPNYPVARRLLLGNDDTVWVQFWDGGRWCALLLDQSILGCLVLEPGEELRAGSREAVWIVRNDGDGIPSISVHEVDWPTGLAVPGPTVTPPPPP